MKSIKNRCNNRLTKIKEEKMEPLTTVILSGILYDMLKHSVSITGQNLKEKLQGWLVDENQSNKLSSAISDLNLDDEMNELAINRRLMASIDLISILNEIPYYTTTTIQIHSGDGDNVAGNKNINN